MCRHCATPEGAEETAESPVEATEKVAEVIICPRCGKECDELIDGDHCDHCEDWFFCVNCNKWKDSEGSSDVDGSLWCVHCVDNDACYCENCENHFESSTTTVRTGRRSTQEWCDRCVDRNACTCEDCGEVFDRGSDGGYVSGQWHCESCLDDNHWWCEDCEEYHDNGESCPNGSAEGIADYGCHGSFVIRDLMTPGILPVFGLEMEIGDFEKDDQRAAMERFTEKLGHDFAYPTHDSSLGDFGIEFISHPMGTTEWLSDERVDKFFEIMNWAGANCSDSNSGCHINVARSAFVSDTALKAAIAAVSRFRDALLSIGDSGTDRGSYCKPVPDDQDPIEGAASEGKYSCVNIKDHESLIEFRVPGMVLDVIKFRAQIQLYANLIAWANGVSDWKIAGKSSFGEIFLPVIGQETIDRCIRLGEATSTRDFIEPSGFYRLADRYQEADGMILGVPTVGTCTSTSMISVDHDNVGVIGGQVVEVGDVIEFGGMCGIAIAPARNFCGTIARFNFRRRTSNNIYGRSLHNNGTTREPVIEFNGKRFIFTEARERLSEVESIQVSAPVVVDVTLLPNTRFCGDRDRTRGHLFRDAVPGEFGVHPSRCYPSFLVTERRVPVCAGESSYAKVEDRGDHWYVRFGYQHGGIFTYVRFPKSGV